MLSFEIRKKFINYFQKKNHIVLESSPLPIKGDPTLLFNAAGMAPLKPYFLGIEEPPGQRLTSCQKCIRTIDIDSVGKTPRHCTFFEMLGNFSIGDYFKKEAIGFSWDFLLNELNLDKENLWVTVHQDDSESADIWINDIGFPEKKILFLNEDNFWSMGPTGPCGPCSEIFYDFGEHVDPGKTPSENSERFMEIWNLVFMSKNKTKDGSLENLPSKNIDTGMGLERITAAVQGKSSVFETDIFKESLSFLNSISMNENLESKRIVVDHLKSSAFLIGDGVLPSNVGKGYVLRRILRRAIRAGRILGIKGPFLKGLLPSISAYEDVYKDLKKQKSFIAGVIEGEEESFKKAIGRGERELESRLSDSKKKIISGDIIFEMYDTYGLPLEISEDIASVRGMKIDHEGFQNSLEKQRQRSQSDRSKKGSSWTYLGKNVQTVRKEKDSLSSCVKSIASKNKNTRIILDKTCFYPEGGGQIGDSGVFLNSLNEKVFNVESTFWDRGKLVHEGQKIKEINLNENLKIQINTENRRGCERAHTATHLLHSALRVLYGESVIQAGSLVEKDRLRFDVTLDNSISDKDLLEIQSIVSNWVFSNNIVDISHTSLKDAKSMGAMALFGEKYNSENVRVVKISDFSIELCGGTHVKNTAEIGSFLITNFSSIAQGVKRFEAVTGSSSHDLAVSSYGSISKFSNKWSINRNNFENKISSMEEELKDLKKKIKILNLSNIGSIHNDLIDSAKVVNGVKVVFSKNIDKDILVDLGKSFCSSKEKVIALLSNGSEKFNYCISISETLVEEGLDALKILKNISNFISGGGGGRKNFVQGGGTRRKGLISSVEFIEKNLK